MRVHEARAYADVARVADRQRFLLSSSRRARTTKTAITSLSRMAQESLDDLRARSSGAEAATAAALTVSYRMAARHAAGSVDGTGGGKAATARQAQLELASVEAKAEAALQERQRSVMEASPSLLLDSFQIVAMILVGILALFGSAVVLLSRREPQPAPRRRRAGAPRGGGPHRQPDWARQPSGLSSRPLACGAATRPDGLRLRADGDRPGRAEADQRQPGASGRRRLHPARLRDRARSHGARGNGLSHRRRRVHDPASGQSQLERPSAREQDRPADTGGVRTASAEHRADRVDRNRGAPPA